MHVRVYCKGIKTKTGGFYANKEIFIKVVSTFDLFITVLPSGSESAVGFKKSLSSKPRESAVAPVMLLKERSKGPKSSALKDSVNTSASCKETRPGSEFTC